MALKKPQKKREYKIKLSEVLTAADSNNLQFYDLLDADIKKEVAPLTLMRWLSSVSTNNPYKEHYILAVNDIVNVGFFDLAKFPDLQWKLLATCGVGDPQAHEWIKGPPIARVSSSKLDDLILRLNPSLNNLEIELAKRRFTQNGIQQLCRDLAMEDNEIKPIIEEFKKYKNSKSTSN